MLFQLPMYLVYKFAHPHPVIALMRMTSSSVTLVDDAGIPHESMEGATRYYERRLGRQPSGLAWQAWFVHTTTGFEDAIHLPEWSHHLIGVRRNVTIQSMAACTAAPLAILVTAMKEKTTTTTKKRKKKTQPPKGELEAVGLQSRCNVDTVCCFDEATLFSRTEVVIPIAVKGGRGPRRLNHPSPPLATECTAIENTLHATPPHGWTTQFLTRIIGLELVLPTLVTTSTHRVLQSGLTTLWCGFLHPGTRRVVHVELNTTLLYWIASYRALVIAARESDGASSCDGRASGKPTVSKRARLTA